MIVGRRASRRSVPARGGAHDRRDHERRDAGWRRAGWRGPAATQQTRRKRRRRRRRRRGGGEVAMVDDAEFTSYYGRQIIKTPVWKYARRAALPVPRRRGGHVVGARRRWPTSPAGRRWPGRRRLTAGGGAIASVVLLVARPGPAGAVPAHAAGVQADVAAVGGHLHPVAVQRGGRGDGGGGAAGLVPACCKRVRRASRCRRGSSAGRWPPTPRCCWPTPRCRRGTRRTTSCRSCSRGSAMAAGGGIMHGADAGGRGGPARKMAMAGAAHRAGRDPPGRERARASSASRTTRARPGQLHARGEGVHRSAGAGLTVAGRAHAGWGRWPSGRCWRPVRC